MKHRILLTGLLVPLLFASPLPAAEGKTAPRRAGGFPALRDRYVRTFLRRFPVVGTYLGAEGLDPALAPVNEKLRDYSPAGLRAERQEWTDFEAALKAVDRKGLPIADRVDADVMAGQLAFLLRNLDRQVHERALDVFLEEPLRGVEWLLQGMAATGASTTGTAAEWRMLGRRLSAIPPYLKTALTNVRRGASGTAIPDRRMIRISVEAAGSTADYFEKSLPKKAAEQMLPSLTAERSELEKASAAAAAAFRDFRQGLLTLYFKPDGKALKPEFDRDRFAAGEAEYTWALKNNLRIERSPRELHSYGKTKVAETLQKMDALAKQVAAARGWPDDSLPAVLSKLADDVPATDAEMLSSYRDACQRLVAYGRKTAMFEPPAHYALDVVYTPPPLRDTIGAAYYPAPAFKKTGVGQFYVTPTGDDRIALREHAHAAVAVLAAHEGFPGHDWYYQFLRSKGSAVSPIRWLTPGGVEESTSMWADSMSSEGWALYCEQLVGEPRPDFPEGFYTKEERLFQLQNQLLRDARVVVDTGIHCGFLTFDDAVVYFAKNVYLVKGAVSTDEKVNPDAAERASVDAARKDLYRYSKWPTQAITYHLGKAMILDLREEARKLEGAAFDERRFHEEFLSQGAIPPGIFRDALLSAARGRAAK